MEETVWADELKLQTLVSIEEILINYFQDHQTTLNYPLDSHSVETSFAVAAVDEQPNFHGFLPLLFTIHPTILYTLCSLQNFRSFQG